MTQPAPPYMLAAPEPAPAPAVPTMLARADDAAPPDPLTSPGNQAPTPAGDPAALVPVRTPDGRYGHVKGVELASALDNGAIMVPETDVQRARAAERFGGAGGAVAAALNQWGRRVSFGAYDHAVLAAADLLGGDEEVKAARERLAGTREFNPGATLAGDIAGFVTPNGAPALLGKAVSPIARGLGGLVAGEGAGLGARLVGAGLEGAGQAGLEGAGVGAADQITEAALGNHALTAEQLFAGAGHEALSWMLVGGGLGLGGRAVTESAGAASKALARGADRIGQALSTTVEDAGSIGRGLLEKAGIATTGQPIAGVAGLVDNAGAAYIARTDPAVQKTLERVYREGRMTAQRYETSLDGLTNEVKGAGDPLVRAEDAVDEAAYMQKGEHMARLVDPNLRVAQRDAALGVWKQARDLVDFWGNTNAKGGLEGGVKRVEKWLKDFEAQIGDAVSVAGAEANPERTFMLVDKLKREVGRAAQFGKKAMLVPEAARSFDELYHSIRGTLEDEAVWGQAALAQREVNAANTKLLATRDAFESSFMARYGSERGRPLYELDPAKVKSYLGRITDVESTLKTRAFDDYIDGMRSRFDVTEKHYALTPAQTKAIADGRRGIDALESAMAKARDEAIFVAQAKQLAEAEGHGGGAALAAIAGHSLGGAFGSAVGLGGKFASDAVTKPLTTVERLGAMRRVADKVDTLMKDGVRGLLEKGAGSGTPRALPHTAVQAAAEAARTLAVHSDAMLARASAVYGGVAHAAANVGAMLAATATRAITYLAAEAPKPQRTFASATPHLEKPRYVASDLSKFARKLAAVANPMSVLEDAKNGVLSRDAVHAMAAVYPQIYAAMQQAVMARLAERKTPLPYADRITLGVLLGIPTDPSLEADFLRMLQATKGPGQVPDEQGGASQKPGGRRPLPLNDTSRMTRSERIASK